MGNQRDRQTDVRAYRQAGRMTDRQRTARREQLLFYCAREAHPMIDPSTKPQRIWVLVSMETSNGPITFTWFSFLMDRNDNYCNIVYCPSFF